MHPTPNSVPCSFEQTTQGKLILLTFSDAVCVGTQTLPWHCGRQREEPLRNKVNPLLPIKESLHPKATHMEVDM